MRNPNGHLFRGAVFLLFIVCVESIFRQCNASKFRASIPVKPERLRAKVRSIDNRTEILSNKTNTTDDTIDIDNKHTFSFHFFPFFFVSIQSRIIALWLVFWLSVVTVASVLLINAKCLQSTGFISFWRARFSFFSFSRALTLRCRCLFRY